MEMLGKIKILEEYLGGGETYADSFKGEIYCMIGEFKEGNLMLGFLEKVPDSEAIHNYIDRLTSRIVMKFDQESESLGDFVLDYVENG